MADVEDLVSSEKKSNTKRKANVWCSTVNCSKSDSIALSHMLLAICSISVHKDTVAQPAKKPWPEMEDIKRSGVRAHVFLIIQCTIQISGSVLAKWLFIFTSIAQ
ncbi:Hypothetical predicted protein [Paramuricea clavata]|uniref:Uncharacterized protein n=1 Tax=Paramuricea clavata TaxID=317549 RepID=A0A6S7HFG2_PARCT|nr:Hypothetical predicted protein [Paramuricea clavata]